MVILSQFRFAIYCVKLQIVPFVMSDEYNTAEEVLIVAGVSGIGKSHLTKLLFKEGQHDVVLSTTTREPRLIWDGGEQRIEIDGIDMLFLGEEDYHQAEQDGEFFMTNEFYNAHYGYRYSDVQEIIDKDKKPVAIVYTPVIKQFIDKYPNSRIILLKPHPDVAEELILERLKRRNESKQKTMERFSFAMNEIKEFDDKYGELFKPQNVFLIKDDSDAHQIVKQLLD